MKYVIRRIKVHYKHVFTFHETHKGIKLINLQVKDYDTKIQKVQFEVKVPTSYTRDVKDVQALTSSSRECKPTISQEYHLACDRVRKEIVPPQRYGYSLNVSEGLQESKPNTVKDSFEKKIES